MTQPNGERDHFIAWEEELAVNDGFRFTRWKKWFLPSPNNEIPQDGAVDEQVEPVQPVYYGQDVDVAAMQASMGIPAPSSIRLAAVGLGAGLAVLAAAWSVIQSPTPEAPAISEEVRTKALTNLPLLRRLGVCASDLSKQVTSLQQHNPEERNVLAYNQAIQLAEANQIPCAPTPHGYTMSDSRDTFLPVTVYRQNLVDTGN